MHATAKLAEQLDVSLHTHLAETEDENRFCEQIHGCRPLDYLEQCGWLNNRTWLAHGIHFNAGEIKRLAKAGTTVSHCACSNQVLASGCCPVCEMEDAGVAIGMGVDGSASNDGSNLMQEVRAAFLMQRARYGVGRVSHQDALRWATKGSAACVGRPELGVIAVGKTADLAMFKLDELRFSGQRGPDGGVGSVRRASRRPGDGRGSMGCDRWRDSWPRHARFDESPQRRGACDAGGVRSHPMNAKQVRAPSPVTYRCAEYLARACLFAGHLVVDALDVEVHAEDLPVVEMVAALAFDRLAVLVDHRAFEREELAGGDGGFGILAIFFTSSGMLV